VDHEEKSELGDLNDSNRSKENILQRLRQRRKAQQADDTETEQEQPEKISHRPPPGKELARDPSGDLKSFTGEYETQSENDGARSEHSDGDDNAEEGQEDIVHQEKQQQADHTNSEHQEKQQQVEHINTDDGRHNFLGGKLAKQKSGQGSESSQASPRDTMTQNSKRDGRNTINEQAGTTEAVSKSESVEGGAKTWYPVQEKKNTPLTLHKLGSLDTDDWSHQH
jgi:hypothetical protein